MDPIEVMNTPVPLWLFVLAHPDMYRKVFRVAAGRWRKSD